jgi:O-antigen/teichoic acid export membrane protein
MLIQGAGLAFVSLKFDWLIPNAKTNDQSDRLLISGSISTLFNVALVACICAIWRRQIAGFLNLEGNYAVLLMLPCSIFLGGMLLLFQARAVYRRDLSRVSFSKVAQAIFTLLGSVLLGWLPAFRDGLVVAYILGLIAAVFVLRGDLALVVGGLDRRAWKTLPKILRTYRSQIATFLGLAIVNLAMTSGPVLFLMLFYSPVVVGWYGLVFRAAAAPIGLVTTALVQSFWSDAAALAKADPQGLRTFYLGTIARLVFLALPVALVAALGPLYVPVIFGGEEWRGAGLLLAAISPYLFGMVIFSPTTHLIVYRKAHWQLAIDLATFLACFLVFAAIANLGMPAWSALLGASVTILCGYVVRFAAHLRANHVLARSMETRRATLMQS